MILKFVHRNQQLILGSLITMVAIIPVAPLKIPFLAWITWSIGWHFLDRKLLYKFIFVYSAIFTLIMFPIELVILESIDSILITPFIVGSYPMILTWFFWIVFFATSIAVQWILTIFWAYIIERYTGKWMNRLPFNTHGAH